MLAFIAPGYFSRDNLTDLFLANVPVLIIALGMTLIILTGQIDISVGSIFAVCGVAAGVFAKAGLPMVFAGLCGCLVGAAGGREWRASCVLADTLDRGDVGDDGRAARLRWITQGAWVEDLPSSFQWLGFSRSSYQPVVFVIAGGLAIAIGWGLRNLAAGRAIYATGSNEEAARLAGINTRRNIFSVFAIIGALTGLAALLNSVRFNQIPSNAGLGLEMKVIAAVVVGGAAITGGTGTILGTVLGAILLGAIGPALTFLGINAYWEKAIQGAIILAAIVADAARMRFVPGGIGKDANRAATTRA